MTPEQQKTRNEAKLHPVHIDWMQSPKNDPSAFLNRLYISSSNIVDKLVYYWICEYDMTTLKEDQLENMNYCQEIAYCCS